MNFIEYGAAKISQPAADMLADMQCPKESAEVIEALDSAICCLIHSIGSIDECMKVVEHIRNLYWLRDFLNELLKPNGN